MELEDTFWEKFVPLQVCLEVSLGLQWLQKEFGHYVQIK